MQQHLTAAPRIIGGLGEIASHYDVILCDVWGVVHDGETHYAPATAALAAFRANGGAVVLITNAPRPSAPILRQLDHFGAPRAAYDALVTSGDVTIAAIANEPVAPVLHIGPRRDHSLFDEAAIVCGRKLRLAAAEEAGFAVCTGLYEDEGLLDPAQYDALFTRMLARRLTMICANPDLVVHVGAELIYCAGALAQAYAARGGLVVMAGKPHAPIYTRSLEVAAKALGRSVDRARVLAIGDAMRTDIEGAGREGLDALFITSGIHRADLHQDDGAIEHEAFLQFFAATPHAPRYAMPALTL